MSKSAISVLIGLALGLLLLAGWLYMFDYHSLIDSLKQLKTIYIIPAGIVYLLAYFIRSIRWNLLLKRQISLTIKETWLISSAGNWINYLIPIRAGELLKAMLIKRIKGRSAVSILPSIFIDKFFDTLGIFVVLSLIPFMHISISPSLKWLIMILVLMFVILLAILLLAVRNKSRVTVILQTVFFWLPAGMRTKIYNLIELFINGLNVLEHHYSIIIYCLLLTVAGVLADGLYFYLVFLAFGGGVAFLIVLFGYTLINLSYALPQPPAQLGSNEWMMIIIFSIGFGLTRNTAAVIMAFAHVFTALLITLLGVIGFSYAGIRSVKQLSKEL